MSLKERVEGNELDLSLNQLTEVPVKDLAAVPKATRLDISCNRIRTLPREFSTLTHLVKIDLSNNSLVELPDNFGNLYNLQYLDLYSNHLENIPVSFCRLKKLTWLDLKNNPLDAKLKAVAGDCLDEKECLACAKKIVSYMQGLDSDLEREKQKNLKAVRAKEALEKAKVEQELEEQRRLKKLEREKRKAEYKAMKASKADEEAEQIMKDNLYGSDYTGANKERIKPETCQKSHIARNICITLLMFILIASAILGFLVWKPNVHTESLNVYAQHIFVKVKLYSIEAVKLIQYYYPIARENILKIVHHYMISMTQFAAKIEEIVSLYV